MSGRRAERKQILWLTRNRAYRLLAANHKVEFRRLRDQELAAYGEPPVQSELELDEEQ